MKSDLKAIKKYLEESKKRRETPSLAAMVRECKELIEMLVVMQMSDKVAELKASLVGKPEDESKSAEDLQEQITATEQQNYITKDADKFDKAMTQLSNIATRKGLDHFIMYRPTADLEYQTCKDAKTSKYNTSLLDQGKGVETVWYLSMKGAEHGRVQKNPLVEAIIPKSAISGFLFPPGIESSQGGVTDDKWIDIIQVKVAPGSYEVSSEYLGNW